MHTQYFHLCLHCLFSSIFCLLFLLVCVCLEKQLFFLFLPFPILLSASCLRLFASPSRPNLFLLFLPWDPGGLGLRFLFPLPRARGVGSLRDELKPDPETGDSSAASFSYREILREKESSTVPARVRGREATYSPSFYPDSGPSTHIFLSSFPQAHKLDRLLNGR